MLLTWMVISSKFLSRKGRTAPYSIVTLPIQRHFYCKHKDHCLLLKAIICCVISSRKLKYEKSLEIYV